jgi:hypothetical protein
MLNGNFIETYERWTRKQPFLTGLTSSFLMSAVVQSPLLFAPKSDAQEFISAMFGLIPSFVIAAVKMNFDRKAVYLYHAFLDGMIIGTVAPFLIVANQPGWFSPRAPYATAKQSQDLAPSRPGDFKLSYNAAGKPAAMLFGI